MNKNLPQFKHEATQFVHDFTSELTTKANEMPSDKQPMKNLLLETARKVFLLQDYAEVYIHFYDCFAYEKHLLQQAECLKNITQLTDDLEVFVFQTGLFQDDFFPQDASKQKAIALGREMFKSLCPNFKSGLQDTLIDLHKRYETCSEKSQLILNLVNNSDRNDMRKIFEKQFQIIDCDTIQSWYQSLAEILGSIIKQLLALMTYQKNSADQNIKQFDLSPLHRAVTNTLTQLPPISFAPNKKKEKKEHPKLYTRTYSRAKNK